MCFDNPNRKKYYVDPEPPSVPIPKRKIHVDKALHVVKLRLLTDGPDLVPSDCHPHTQQFFASKSQRFFCKGGRTYFTITKSILMINMQHLHVKQKSKNQIKSCIIFAYTEYILDMCMFINSVNITQNTCYFFINFFRFYIYA